MTNAYYADDSHKAIIGLRILSIITTLPVFPAVAWTMPAHDKVINDGVGWGINPGLLAAVRFPQQPQPAFTVTGSLTYFST